MSEPSSSRVGPLVKAVKSGTSGGLVPRRLRMFPFTKPTWPASVAREKAANHLFADYDTDWARRPVAKAARRAVIAGALRPVAQGLARPTIKGLDRIEHLDGPAVFAANHHSHLDVMLLLTSIPARLRAKTVVAAGADYFFDTRLKAMISALAIGAIPIERKRVHRASADRVQRLLEDGWNLVIFPEGTRSPDGWGQDWKPGAAFLAVRTDSPVVPVHIEGTGRVLPKGRSWPRPGRTTVTFGHPIWAGPGEDARRLSQRLERAVTALADEYGSDWYQARVRAHAAANPSLRGPEGVDSWRRQWELTGRERATKKPRRRWP